MANRNPYSRRDREHSPDSLFGSPTKEEKSLQSRQVRHAANTLHVEDADYRAIQHETPKRIPGSGMDFSVTSPAPVARMVPIGRSAVQGGSAANNSANRMKVQEYPQGIRHDERISHQTQRTPVGRLGDAARMDTHGRGGSREAPLVIPEISDDDDDGESDYLAYQLSRNPNTDGERFGSLRTGKHGRSSYPLSTRQTATQDRSHRQPGPSHASLLHSIPTPPSIPPAMPSSSLHDGNATMGQKRPRLPSPNMEVGSAPKRALTNTTPRPGPFLSSSSSSDEEATKSSLPAPGRKLNLGRLKQALLAKAQATAKVSPTFQADNSNPTTPNLPQADYGDKTPAPKATERAPRGMVNSIPSRSGFNTVQPTQKDTKPSAKSEGGPRGESNSTLGHTPKAYSRDARTAEAPKRPSIQETNSLAANNVSRGMPKSNNSTKALQTGQKTGTAPPSTGTISQTPALPLSQAEKRVPPWGNGQQGVQKQRTVQKPASEPQASQNSQRSPNPPAKAGNSSGGVNKLSSAGSLPSGKNPRLSSDNESRSTPVQNARLESAQVEKRNLKNGRLATSPAEPKRDPSTKTDPSAPFPISAQSTPGLKNTAAERTKPGMADDARGRPTPHRNGSLVNSPVTGAKPMTGLQGKVPITTNAISPVPVTHPQSNETSKQDFQNVTRESSLVAPPKSSVKAPLVETRSGSEVRQYSNSVGQNGANGKDEGKKDTPSAATSDVFKDKTQQAQKERTPKMASVGNLQKPTEAAKKDPRLSGARSTPITETNILDAETGKEPLQPAGVMESRKDALGDTIMKDAADSLLTEPRTQDRTSRPITQTTLFTPPKSTPRTDLSTITAPSGQTPEPEPTTTNTTPNTAHPSGATLSTGATTLLPGVVAPPIPETKTFTYTLYQKLYTELDDPSKILSIPLSQPYTSLSAANAQASLLFTAAKSYQESHGVQFSSVKEFRDENDCLVFICVGTNPAAGEEVAGRKNYCRIWVDRRVVLGNMNGIERAAVSNAAGGKTEYISKTLFMLRLCKVIISDSDDSDAEDGENNEANLEYIPLSSPSIRRLDVFSEIYTVRAQANSAARRLQIGLSHKKEPLKETERKWQEEENRRLMDRIHVLEGLDTVIGSGSEGEDGEEQDGPGGRDRKGVGGKDKGKGKKKTELEIEAEKPVNRRGCWESEFNGLGGERYKLWVERVKVCGPRNM